MKINTNQDYNDLYKKIHISVTDKFNQPQELLLIDEAVIFTIGNISVSTGKAKSKKTFNLSAIVAAVIRGGTVLKYSAGSLGKQKVLYVDTEQSFYHCSLVLQRIIRLSDRDLTVDTDDIVFLALREYDPLQRRFIIEESLKRIKGIGLLVIDGIRDLMYDINDAKESLELVNMLMKWSTIYSLHIHTVLHLNKNDDQLRGHVGTELCNKAESILHIVKDNKDNDMSMVRPMYVRGKEFSIFSFKINDCGLPELVNCEINYYAKQKMKFTNLTRDEHVKALKSSFNSDVVKGYSNAIERIKIGYQSIGFIRGRNVIVNLCKYLINEQILIKTKEGYKLNDDS